MGQPTWEVALDWLVAISLLLAVVLYAKRCIETNTISEPWNLYLLTWMFTIGVYYLHFVYLYALTPDTLAVFFLAGALFWLGTRVPVLIRHAVGNNVQAAPATSASPFVLQAYIATLCVAGMIGTYLFASTVVGRAGYESIVTDPRIARYIVSDEGFRADGSFLFLLTTPCLVLCVLYWSRFGSRTPRWIYLAAALCIASCAFSTDRTKFFHMILWASLALLTMRRITLGKRTLLVMGTVAAGLTAFFLVIAFLYDKVVPINEPQYVTMLPDSLSGVSGVYLYTAGPLPTFQEILRASPESLPPRYSLLPLDRLVNAFDPNHPVPRPVMDFYYVPVAFNVATYLETYYQDFGWLGLTLVPFILGLFSAALHILATTRKTFTTGYLYGLAAFCIVMTPFLSYFSMTYIWYLAILGLLFLPLSQRLSNDKYGTAQAPNR